MYLFQCARLNRRLFLTSASLAGAAAWADRAFGAVKQNVALAGYPFTLGVASGDPTENGFVIWTRLAPKPLEGGGMPEVPVQVWWQVAQDEAMTKVVREGTTSAVPEWAHSVHVEVEGLDPDRWYWYQFKAAGETSAKGRTRTMPAADAAPKEARIALASCQHIEGGLYTAYEHMAKDDIDLVFFVGDYIYEGPTGPKNPIRNHIGGETFTLEDYRTRHALYKQDKALQAMHASAPWMITWDDHEVDNNYAGEFSEKLDPKEAFLTRRAAAYKAYYEHMPLRRTSLPTGPDMLLYRSVSFSNLAEFYVLDTRQYRTDQPCGDEVQPPCDGTYDPKGTMLGEKQRDWLMTKLKESKGGWNSLVQGVQFARVDRKAGDEVGYNMDKWPGYEVERRAIVRFFDEQQIKNPVILSGDIHSNWANEINLEADRPDSKVVATEFVGTSISSAGNGTRRPKYLDSMLAENPFVKFHNEERGYVRCIITRDAWKTDFQTVEYITRPGAPLKTRASFTVESGRPSLADAVIDQS